MRMIALVATNGHLMGRFGFAALLLAIASIATGAQNVTQNSTSKADQETPTTMVRSNLTTPLIAAQTFDSNTNASQLALIESLNERLVKNTQLQAEESNPNAAATIVLPPPRVDDNLDVSAKSSKPNQAPITFTGGSGNSYMSLSRDGSNRYEFGFDTSEHLDASTGAQREHSISQQASPTWSSQSGQSSNSDGHKQQPRLMREESRLDDGTVVGRYGYTDPFNVFRIVQYVAGPDGYFATEEVGALAGDRSSLESSSRSANGSRFQLNKQLHRALQQARLNRLRRQQQQQQQRQPDHGHQQAQVGGGSALMATATAPEAVQVERKPTDEQPAEAGSAKSGSSEQLEASGNHQSVRYATRINHVVGSNGVTYATAFRPLVWGQQMQQPQQVSAIQRRVAPMYASERLLLADNYAAVQTSGTFRGPTDHKLAPPLLQGQVLSSRASVATPLLDHNHQRDSMRSKLPAPIWSPLQVNEQAKGQSYEFAIDHNGQAGNAGGQQRAESRQPASYGHPMAPSRPMDGNYAAPFVVGQHNQWPAAIKVLQASPAWSVLSNNYQGNYHTSVIIDHHHRQQPAQTTANVAALNEQMSANFKQEAALLAGLRNAKSRYAQSPEATSLRQQLQLQQQSTFREASRGPTEASESGIALDHEEPIRFGSRRTDFTNNQSPNAISNYNSYQFTLKHLEPPLYPPEVHETSSRQLASGPDPIAVAPTRGIPSEDSSLSSSSTRSDAQLPVVVVAAAGSDGNAGATAISRHSTAMLLDTSLADLSRAATTSTSGSGSEVALEDNKLDVKPQQQPVAYATRLSGQSVPSNEELSMEDSEQVAAYSMTTNGTTGLSRARMPTDRSRKLSSIFKSRSNSMHHQHLQSASGEAEEHLNATSGAYRIRRPIPVNVKRQLAVAATSTTTTSTTTTTTTKTSTTTTPAPNSSEQPALSELEISSTKVDKTSELQQKQTELQLDKMKQEFANISATTTNIVADYSSRNLTNNDVDTTPNGGRAMIIEGNPELVLNGSARKHSNISVDFKTTLNREMLEKIMRIQQEIAAKASIQVANSQTTTPSTNNSTTTTTSPPSQRSDNHISALVLDQPPTTIKPLIEVTAEAATTIMPTNNNNNITSTTTTTTAATLAPELGTTMNAPTSVSSSVAPVVPRVGGSEPISETQTKAIKTQDLVHDSLVFHNKTSETLVSATTETTALQIIANQTNDSDLQSNFLTGPLMQMDSSATFSSSSSSTSIGDLNNEQDDFMAKLSRDLSSFDSSRASSFNSSLATMVAPTIQGADQKDLNSHLAATTTTTTTTTTGKPSITNDTANNGTIESESGRREVQPVKMVELDELYLSKHQNSSSIQMLGVSLKQSVPTANATIVNNLLAPGEVATASDTSSPTRVSSTTLPPKSTRPSANGPRQFGRLVIKRGDKVVARYNASDSIPDSMIPTGAANSSDIVIQPDLPRLGMRRTKKVKKLIMFSGFNATTNETKALVEAIRGNQLANKRSLLRPGRSASHEGPVTNEGSLLQLQLQTLSATTKRPKRQDSRNWSVRLRDRIQEDKRGQQVLASGINGGASAAINQESATAIQGKPYDADEDLKKLVEKIERVQVKLDGQDREPGDRLVKSMTINETETNVIRGETANVTTTPLTTTTTTTTTTLKPSEPNNLSKQQMDGLNVTNLAAKAIARSESRTKVFTVPLSVELEKRWEHLKPLNGTDSALAHHQHLISAKQESANGNGGQEIRVDLRGYIHVRNNQSVTVLVDIEPPPRDGPSPMRSLERIKSKPNVIVNATNNNK